MTSRDFLKRRECTSASNRKEQGSNTDRVRGVTPTGATHSQKVSSKNERALQNCVKIYLNLDHPLQNALMILSVIRIAEKSINSTYWQFMKSCTVMFKAGLFCRQCCGAQVMSVIIH